MDYQAGKISKKTYDTAFRQHKIDAAEARGSSSEQRKYQEKIRKETDIIDRERARQDIAISAEKAYMTSKARSAGRQAGIIATQQQFAIQQQQQRQRRWVGPVWQKSPFRQPTLSELDPMGIYQIRPRQVAPNNTTQPQIAQTSNHYDLSHLHSLLGYNTNRIKQPTQETPKVNTDFAQEMLGFNPQQQSQQSEPKAQTNKIKRRKLNIFTGQWEWV